MAQNITALERAFQVAKSGSCRSIDDIKKLLKSEGYSTTQIEGGTLLKQLRALMQTAQGLPPIAPGRPRGFSPTPRR
jgi:hypothetical protein